MEDEEQHIGPRCVAVIPTGSFMVEGRRHEPTTEIPCRLAGPDAFACVAGANVVLEKPHAGAWCGVLLVDDMTVVTSDGAQWISWNLAPLFKKYD